MRLSASTRSVQTDEASARKKKKLISCVIQRVPELPTRFHTNFVHTRLSPYVFTLCFLLNNIKYIIGPLRFHCSFNKIRVCASPWKKEEKTENTQVCKLSAVTLSLRYFFSVTYLFCTKWNRVRDYERTFFSQSELQRGWLSTHPTMSQPQTSL